MTESGTALGRGELHRQKVLAHFETRLAPLSSATDSTAFARVLRRFLAIEDYRLRMNHNFGASGCETAAGRSFVLDLVVKYAFQHAALVSQSNGLAYALRTGCALLAIGGYGRAELAPYSDIDLLFLYSGQRQGQMKPVLAKLLQVLWDTGLTLGHSFRTVGDCVTTALDDVHLRTAVVNTRLLAGNKGLHNSLQEALDKDRRRRAKPFVTAILHEREARYLKFGGAVCLQEPNIKETAGGLRDFQTAVWLAHAQYGYQNLDEMRAHALISEDEARRIVCAYDFLWRVRHEAHFQAGRKTERLSLAGQPALAGYFGYHSGTHLLGSEKFMRDYYRHARQLHLFSEALIARVGDGETRGARRWLKRPANTTREPFAIRRGRLFFDGESDFFDRKPLAIFNAFALGQAARVPFDFRLRELIMRSARAIGPASRSSIELSHAFFQLLRRRGRAGFVLRSLHDLGLLERLIPEFSRISLLVQHDQYHHFTVDEHTLRAIETIDDLHNSEGKHRAHLRSVFDQIKDPTLLYLAVLLHDIGKGQGRSHIARGAQVAERVCRRLGLNDDDAGKVVLLVKEHVTMAHLAQRRDLTESRLISDFARQVESLDVLNMLLLLTYADLSAVGPGVWTEWKSTLLWDLYRRTRKHLTGEDAVIDDVVELVRIKEEIGQAIPAAPFSEVERHLALLPDRYLRVTSPAAIARHIEMLEVVAADGFACRWVRGNVTSTELIVATHDRHGLFADLAGTLAANGIEILSAEVNTREDGIAIDNFTIRQASTRRAVEEDRYSTIEQFLGRAAAGELEVAALVERWSTRNAPRKRTRADSARRRSLPKVICDNEASASSTLIEVHAIDEPGLAYKIASVLAGLGLEIICARIATERSDALDVFYVTVGEGLKLSDEMIEAVEKALVKQLETTKAVMAAPTPPKMAGRHLHEKNRSDHQTASAGRR